MYRFSQAAAAIGVTEPALRNWMTRNKLDLWEERPEGGWRTFTAKDVWMLALAAELVSYGAQVETAVNAIQAVVAEAKEADPQNLPKWIYAVRSRFGGWEVHADEAFALSLGNDRSILKIAPHVIMSRANLHLRTDGGKAAQAGEVAA